MWFMDPLKWGVWRFLRIVVVWLENIETCFLSFRVFWLSVLWLFLWQSDSVLLESLRKLRLMALTVDTLKVGFTLSFSVWVGLIFFGITNFFLSLIFYFLYLSFCTNGACLSPGNWDWKGCQWAPEAWIKADSTSCTDFNRVCACFLFCTTVSLCLDEVVVCCCVLNN